MVIFECGSLNAWLEKLVFPGTAITAQPGTISKFCPGVRIALNFFKNRKCVTSGLLWVALSLAHFSFFWGK